MMRSEIIIIWPLVFPRQPGRVAIVTGGTEGIGLATSKRLALLGMHVIIAGNDSAKGRQVVRKIREEMGNQEGLGSIRETEDAVLHGFTAFLVEKREMDTEWPDEDDLWTHNHLATQLEFAYCDLASLRSVREFVLKFKEKKRPLHVLVNNAGVMMVPQRETEDGFEEHFGLNYLGHFLLTNLLLDTLRRSGRPGREARVVTLSSATHYVGELALDDLQSRDGYSPHGAYAQSKLALVLFTYHLQALLAAQGCHVTANVADPGVVDTDLYRHVFWGTRLVKKLFGRWFFKTPDEGAWTSVYAAVTPELEGAGGRYLYNERETQSLALTYDRRLQHQLWARSCRMTGIRDPTGDILSE